LAIQAAQIGPGRHCVAPAIKLEGRALPGTLRANRKRSATPEIVV